MSLDNPIRSVTPLDASGSPVGPAVTQLPSITRYKVGIEDVGGSADRRAESRKATNRRIGTAAVIHVEWRPCTAVNAAVILQAFKSKFLLIEYFDPETGIWQTKEFIVDDRRDLTLLDIDLELWDSVGFTLVQRTPDYD